MFICILLPLLVGGVHGLWRLVNYLRIIQERAIDEVRIGSSI
jgi:hypothetical protein